MSVDLWPEFQVPTQPRRFRQILEEVGAGLETKTKGLVQFRVRPLLGAGSDPEGYDCRLDVPNLDFSQLFLRIKYHHPDHFPVDLYWEDDHFTIEDEKALREKLAEIFHSDRTKAIISRLMSLAI
jgi:hypothetical protein